MKKLVLCVLLMLAGNAPALTPQTYIPSGWLYFSGSYAYDNASHQWRYFDSANPHWCINLSGTTWVTLDASYLAAGWSYWMWPYAYSATTGSWFYLNEGVATQWVCEMGAGAWTLFGTQSKPVSTVWTPGQSIGRVALGDLYATVRLNLGTPDEIRRTEEADVYTMWTDYHSLGLSMPYLDTNGNGFLDDNEWVDGVFADRLLVDPPLWTHQGITFGSSTTAALAVLGAPSDRTDPSTTTSIWWFDSGTMLYFSADHLETIYVFDPF